MANICTYKIKAVGRKSACLALINMLPSYKKEKEISVTGTEQLANFLIICDCKETIDYNTQSWKNPKLFSDELISTITDGDFCDIPLKDKSIVLGLDIACNQIDSNGNTLYIHFNNGEQIYDDCPDELLFH